MSAAGSERILVLAPFGRDADLASRTLRNAGLAAEACPDLASLSAEIPAGAGAVLLVQEALPAGDESPDAWIGPEPAWSALPVIVLVRRASSGPETAALRALETRAKVHFLERPVPRRTLVSVLRAAIQSRRRQYAVRDLLEERARLLGQLDSRLAELETLYQTAPIGLGMLDPEMRFLRVNTVLAEINGVPASDHLHKVAWDVVPDLQSKAEARIREVLQTGRTVTGFEVSGETPAQPGVKRTWVESFYPIRSGEGPVQGVGIVVEEVTEQRRAAARQAMLTQELNHRVKNMLATVLSIARQTSRASDSMEAFERALEGRLSALARGHDLLMQTDWQPTSLAILLEQSLRPFLGDGQVRLESAAIELAPRAALAVNLIVHELATNAAKYGALSVPHGRLDVHCERRETDPETVEFTWTERDGPPVQPPRREGFGSRLIDSCVRFELHGDAQMRYEPTGFRCAIRFPLAS